jgi:DNA helicase-2/ATP-dependent DNA helicase PcrA
MTAGQHSSLPNHDGPAWLEPAAPRGTGAAKSAVDEPDIFDKLTPPQARAVRHTEGPLLVLAAAGSGKTRVITRRIAYLISCGVPPWSILALTFTNKAAGEMRDRVLTMLNPSGDPENRATRGLTVTTFHALCARLLRRYASHAGLREDYTIYDSADQSALVKKAIEGLQLSAGNFPPRTILTAISHAKNQLLDAGAYAARASDFSSRHIAKIYLAYEKALRAANAVDFDDLLLLTAGLLERDAQVRGELQRRYQYLLVDEYQDTNKAQFLIAKLLAGDGGGSGSPNICVVGDPDQAIYGWRGADISNILDFEAAYSGCAVIALGENFRSTAPILKAADSLIRKNKRRKHKELFTSRPGGDKLEATLCRDERHEARIVADWFAGMRDTTRRDAPAVAWKDMAVFYRTNALSRVMEDELRSAGVPYTIARGTAFYEREEVRNAVAYLRLLANPSDDVNLERIVNTPSRGLSDKTIEAVAQHAGITGKPLLSVLRHADEVGGLSPRAVKAAAAFVAQVDAWTDSGSFLGASVASSLAEFVDRVLKESGLQEMYRKQAAQSKSDADEQRLDNLDELVSSARQFEQEYDPASDASLDTATAQTPPLLAMLRAYLESITLVADADSVDPASGSVTLMTLHAAKGLEFHAVAMIGMEEGLLPHARALTSVGEAEMEEERRLCFVGITRAMRRLMLTSAKYRTVRGVPERTTPSRFLAEIDQSQLDVRDLSGDGWEAECDDDSSEDGDISRPASRKPALSGIAARFSPGTKVRHPQFGVGTVKAVTPGAQARAVIEFREAGTKTLVLEFARLVPIA